MFNIGDRVEIIGTPSGLALTSQFGTVSASDERYEGFFIVRLDEPAIYYATGEVLEEITTSEDTLKKVEPIVIEFSGHAEAIGAFNPEGV